MKKKQFGGRRLLLLAALMAALVGQLGVLGRVSPPPLIECEGDACGQVSVAFDDAKGQYKARNNSSDRWARVTASNVTAASSVCLAPGKTAYLTLKNIVGPYHATYAPARCGEEDPSGSPPAGE